MVLWVVGSILHGGPIQLFLIPGQCTMNVVKKKGCGICYHVCGIMHIKEPLLLIRKSSPMAATCFLSHYLNDPLPYLQHHITVTKCVECVVK